MKPSKATLINLQRIHSPQFKKEIYCFILNIQGDEPVLKFERSLCDLPYNVPGGGSDPIPQGSENRSVQTYSKTLDRDNID